MRQILQERLTPAHLWEDAKFFFLLNLGLFLTAIGTALFKAPNHFAFGGTTGLSVILSTLWPQWNVGAFMWLVNAVLVVLGFLFLGVRSMGWTIFSSFALSFYVSLCEKLWPLKEPMTDDVFLELCFAVILPALGAAVVFNIGASSFRPSRPARPPWIQAHPLSRLSGRMWESWRSTCWCRWELLRAATTS